MAEWHPQIYAIPDSTLQIFAIKLDKGKEGSLNLGYVNRATGNFMPDQLITLVNNYVDLLNAEINPIAKEILGLAVQAVSSRLELKS